jgi:hypothetical protein
MDEEKHEQVGQSIVLVAIALLALVIFAAISVDVSNGYVNRRTAQNAADGAALAGARQLAYQINTNVFSDQNIKIEMNDFGERNGIKDTDGALANALNANVEGYYLDEKGHRISNVLIGSGTVPADAWGIEAFTYITAPTFLGGVIGLDGLPLQATAQVILEKACGASCVVPVATYGIEFTSTATCYNIWNGSGPGNFGWLNWSWQETFCDTADCSSPCLVDNLTPGICRSGFIRVGDWVAGTTGVSNDSKIRKMLQYYIDTPEEFTVVVWDKTNNESGCGPWPNGLHYRVAGFARMQLLGYQLSQGPGYDPFVDPSTCVTLGEEPNDGNRLTARFIDWVGGEGGNCKAIGTLRAPRLQE